MNKNDVSVFHTCLLTIQGELLLYQNDENSALIITGVVAGVAPDGLHGFHIHQFGNLSDSCKGAGPHFNPSGVNRSKLGALATN